MKEKYIYFIGIGGIGMSAIARYYKFRGCSVSGYDRTPSELTAELEAEGIAVHYEDRPDLVPKDVEDTLVIWTPAIPHDLRELVYVQQRGYRLLKRSQVLGEIARPLTCLAVAGTHGKTTTSTLLAHILTSCGEGCTAFLGGISKNYGTNFLFSDNPVIVAEADEFDRSFLQLYPAVAAITAMDADHLDIYSDLSHVQEAFRAFASQVSDTLIVKYGLPISPSDTKAGLLTYSYDNPEADFYASNIRRDDCGYFTFDLNYPRDIEKDDRKSGENGNNEEQDNVGESRLVAKDLRCGVPGRVNVENSVAAAAIALSYGLTPERIRPGIATFQGAKRRFDIHYNSPTCSYIDDYAHHPKELSAALTSIRDIFPGRRVTAIFQPHLYTRTRDFAPEFAEALSKADKVILLDIYPAREEPIPGVTSEIIFKDITAPEKVLITKEELMPYLEDEPVDVLISFGAGNIDRYITPITELLENRK
ncbi:MAG: UDP-N-acetylmuramate--L-alanine ligase [Bacteroidales bacterium]|nr:UDP-N-acetylmuramate--L-alanine ligase [Bacteroidales bacterium]